MIDVSVVMDGLLDRIKGRSFRRLFLKYRIREVIKGGKNENLGQ
jgi:hypothetical protein